MSRPPSQAVIEAVEQAEREHHWNPYAVKCACGWGAWGGLVEQITAHRRAEVARAAEAAALRSIAGDWLIERTYGLSDEGIKGWPEINADAYRCAIEDAQLALRAQADELTDETGEQ